MYGLLNAALKEYVSTQHGADAWQAVVRDVSPGLGNFNKMEPYPDALTVNLLKRTSEVSAIPIDELLAGFGEFWVRYTDDQGYGPLFEIAGDSLRDFLLSLNKLHARVGRSFPKLQPPAFRFDHLDDRGLRMHYLTERKDLCPMIPGILRGLSARFKTPVHVVEDQCARRGAPHCEFVVAFPEVSSE